MCSSTSMFRKKIERRYFKSQDKSTNACGNYKSYMGKKNLALLREGVEILAKVQVIDRDTCL